MIRSPYFADHTWLEIDELRRADRPVVLLWPLGATEPHGPHAPLATDTLISMSTCERAVEILMDGDDGDVTALILPAVPFGVTRYGAAFPGGIGVDAATLRAVISDACRSLAEHGLSRVVLVNNHFEPEHVTVLRQTVDDLNHELGDGSTVVLLDLLRRQNVERLPDEFRAGEAHGGRYETSMVLADHMDLVDAGRMQDLPHVPVDMAKSIAEGKRTFVAMGMDQAYCGDPARASPGEGEATLGTLAGMVVEMVRALVFAETPEPS